MFKIQTPIGFVQRYSAAYQCVQVTDERGAKKFKDLQSAQAFLDTYADGGMGLVSATAKIVAVNKK